MRAKLGDRRSAFDDGELKRMLIAAGLRDVKVGVGARKAGDPFTVLIASGTKPIARTTAKARNTKPPMMIVPCREQGRAMNAYSRTARPPPARRILILDGAMGTMVQRHKLTEADFRGERFADHPRDLKGNNDLLVLTRPDVIAGIHRAVPRGRQPTSSRPTRSAAPSIAQADYGLESLVYELNVAGGAAGARGRRRVDRAHAGPAAVRRRLDGADQPHAVDLAGRQQPGVPQHDVRRAARGVQGAGARADRRRLRSAAARDDRRHAQREGRRSSRSKRCSRSAASALPLMISVTITDRSGRTLSGQTIDAFWVSIAHARPFSVGINCALGARDMRPYIAELARIADCYISCYPNAGLPNAFGEYDEQPADTGGALREFADERLREHRRRLLRHDAGSHRGDRRRRVDGLPPRESWPEQISGRPHASSSRSSPASRR